MADDLLKLISSRGVSPQHAILDVLVGGESYGLAIRDAVFERTRGTVALGPGTLYPALRALERDGLVTSRVGEPSTERGGKPKVYYAVTELGVVVATALREQAVGMFGGREDA